MKKIIALFTALFMVLALGFAGSTAQATDQEAPCDEPTITVVVTPAFDEVVHHDAVTKVVHHDAVTETTPAVWANFSPNETKGTFVGPAVWPTDVRGTWHIHNKIPGGHVGPDGVYSKGNPAKGGNWFYRQAEKVTVITEAFDETVVVKEAFDETVHHDAVTKEVDNPNFPCDGSDTTEITPEVVVVDKCGVKNDSVEGVVKVGYTFETTQVGLQYFTHFEPVEGFELVGDNPIINVLTDKSCGSDTPDSPEKPDTPKTVSHPKAPEPKVVIRKSAPVEVPTVINSGL